MSRKIISIFIILIIALVAGMLIWTQYNRSRYHISAIEQKTSDVIELKSNICAYMEQRPNPGIRGKENYHCANKLYGYDDKYAYAWVCCEGFVGNRGGYTMSYGFGIPTRFEFIQPHFQIIKFEQPRDGDIYDSDIRKLFPRAIYQRYVNSVHNYGNTEAIDLGDEIETKAGLK
jgi:hypothetical protein